jgi:hypothetical protein
MKPLVAKLVRVGVIYATTGILGLGVLAWMSYRARRSRAELPAEGAEEEFQTLSAA